MTETENQGQRGQAEEHGEAAEVMELCHVSAYHGELTCTGHGQETDRIGTWLGGAGTDRLANGVDDL